MPFSEVEAYYKTPVTGWTPTSEVAGFEADNMLDGLDVTWWRATGSGDQELVFDAGDGNTIDFDYLAIGAGHNLNTIGATVTWQKGDNALSYSNVIAPFVPTDDKSFVMKAGSTQTFRAIKVKITGASAAANITAMLSGELTVLGFARLYDPHRRRREQIVNITEGGRLAGASIKHTMREIDAKFKQVDDTLYTKIDDLWQNNGLKIFFLSWEPSEHSTEVWPVFISRNERNSPFVKSGVLRDDSLRLRGLYE